MYFVPHRQYVKFIPIEVKPAVILTSNKKYNYGYIFYFSFYLGKRLEIGTEFSRSTAVKVKCCSWKGCLNPHNSSNWRSHIIRQFGYKHTFCQNVVPIQAHRLSKCCCQKNCLTLYFRKNKTCLNVGLLRIGQIFSVFCKTVYRWVTTYWCFRRGTCRPRFELETSLWISLLS